VSALRNQVMVLQLQLALCCHGNVSRVAARNSSIRPRDNNDCSLGVSANDCPMCKQHVALCGLFHQHLLNSVGHTLHGMTYVHSLVLVYSTS